MTKKLIVNPETTGGVSALNVKAESALAEQVGGNHYKNYSIQPIEYLQANKIPWCEANAIKYLSRHMYKGGVEDLKKAIHYIRVCAEMYYGVQL